MPMHYPRLRAEPPGSARRRLHRRREPPGGRHEIARNGISFVPYMPRRSRNHRAHRSHYNIVAPGKPERTMKQEELSPSGIQSRQSRDAVLAAKRITAALLLVICVVAAAFL